MVQREPASTLAWDGGRRLARTPIRAVFTEAGERRILGAGRQPSSSQCTVRARGSSVAVQVVAGAIRVRGALAGVQRATATRTCARRRAEPNSAAGCFHSVGCWPKGTCCDPWGRGTRRSSRLGATWVPRTSLVRCPVRVALDRRVRGRLGLRAEGRFAAPAQKRNGKRRKCSSGRGDVGLSELTLPSSV